MRPTREDDGYFDRLPGAIHRAAATCHCSKSSADIPKNWSLSNKGTYVSGRRISQKKTHGGIRVSPELSMRLCRNLCQGLSELLEVLFGGQASCRGPNEGSNEWGEAVRFLGATYNQKTSCCVSPSKRFDGWLLAGGNLGSSKGYVLPRVKLTGESGLIAGSGSGAHERH